MISSSEALKRSLNAQELALKLLRDSLQTQTFAVCNALDKLDKEISIAASQGHTTVDVYIKNLLNGVPNIGHAQKIAEILEAFGFSVSFSFSSNTENEQIYVSWSN